MVIVRIKAGLGNQMFQYAAGRSLALQKGTTLLLDKAGYETDTFRKYELTRFKISGETFNGARRTLEMQLQRQSLKPLRSLLETVRFPFVPKYIQDLEDGFDERLTKINGDMYLDGFWQSERYFNSIRDILLNEFTFKDAPDQENSRLLSRIGSCNAVCVHIRRGDYLSSQGLIKHGVCPLDYYHMGLEYIRQRTTNPAFFVFSDDPAWAASNFSMFDSTTIVSHNVGRNDVEDMRLMMNCRHFIIANSSFSWWSAWLSRNPEKMVVAPKRWVALSTYSDKDRVPENWIRF